MTDCLIKRIPCENCAMLVLNGEQREIVATFTATMEVHEKRNEDKKETYATMEIWDNNEDTVYWMKNPYDRYDGWHAFQLRFDMPVYGKRHQSERVWIDTIFPKEVSIGMYWKFEIRQPFVLEKVK